MTDGLILLPQWLSRFIFPALAFIVLHSWEVRVRSPHSRLFLVSFSKRLHGQY